MSIENRGKHREPWDKKYHEQSSEVKVYKIVNGKKKLIRKEPPVPKGFAQSKEQNFVPTSRA